MGTVSTIWNGLDWSVLTSALVSVVPALICIVLHELSHGFAAYLLGDMTAKNAGRLTLNPIKHIDIFGLIMMAVCHFGWAKPVPVNMRNFKNPKHGMAITAAAGPLANVVIACVFMFLYGLCWPKLYAADTEIASTLLQMLYMTAYMSLVLAIFNIIPLPPLDGSKIFFSFLSDERYYKLMRYERYGMIVLMALCLLNVFNSPLSTAAGWVADKLFIFAEWGCSLALIFT